MATMNASKRPMRRLALLLAAVALGGAACGGGGGEDRWGGYTERDAKDVLGDPIVRQQILENAPGDPRTSPYRQLVPTKEEVEAADLRKTTLEGQETWEYRDEEHAFCIYVWEDEALKNFATHVGPCIAD